LEWAQNEIEACHNRRTIYIIVITFVYYHLQDSGNSYQLLTEPAAPGAVAKRAMKAEAKRSCMLSVLRSGCVEQKNYGKQSQARSINNEAELAL
jgi:hypothetical protein